MRSEVRVATPSTMTGGNQEDDKNRQRQAKKYWGQLTKPPKRQVWDSFGPIKRSVQREVFKSDFLLSASRVRVRRFLGLSVFLMRKIPQGKKIRLFL